jgi:hypothetical protein
MFLTPEPVPETTPMDDMASARNGFLRTPDVGWDDTYESGATGPKPPMFLTVTDSLSLSTTSTVPPRE